MSGKVFSSSSRNASSAVKVEDVVVDDYDNFDSYDYGVDCLVEKERSSTLRRYISDRMTQVRDLSYNPVERDDVNVDRLSRALTSLPQTASFAARYTAGVMVVNKDEIFQPATYILAPGLAKCPDVVFEIYPSAGVLYLGKNDQILFKFVNDEDVEVITPIKKFKRGSGASFADTLTRTLYDNVFYWSEEPVVVTFNAATQFVSPNGDKQSLNFVSHETGPFNTAIFYGGQTQGGPCGVYSRMRPILETPKSYYDCSYRTEVYCPSDVVIATLMKSDVYRRV